MNSHLFKMLYSALSAISKQHVVRVSTNFEFTDQLYATVAEAYPTVLYASKCLDDYKLAVKELTEIDLALLKEDKLVYTLICHMSKILAAIAKVDACSRDIRDYSVISEMDTMPRLPVFADSTVYLAKAAVDYVDTYLKL